MKYLFLALEFCLEVRGCRSHRSTVFSSSQFQCRCSSSLFRGILWCLIGISQRGTIETHCVEGNWRIFKDWLPIVIYTGHYFLSPAKLESCVPLDLQIKGTSVSPALRVDWTSMHMLLSTNTSSYLCLQTAVRSRHFGIEAFWWYIAVGVVLRGLNVILGTRWRPHEPLYSWMMSRLHYLIGSWWLSFDPIPSRVCSSHFPRAWSSGILAMILWTPSLFLKLGNTKQCFLASAHCHSTCSCPSYWSHSRYICSLQVS